MAGLILLRARHLTWGSNRYRKAVDRLGVGCSTAKKCIDDHVRFVSLSISNMSSLFLKYLSKCYIKSLKEGAVAYVNREIHHAVSTWPVDAE